MSGLRLRLVAVLKHSRASMWLRVRGLRFVMPAYMARLRLGSRKPETFNEKVRYRMARDRRPVLTAFADKLEARRYISETVGPDHVPEVLEVASRATDLPWLELPQEMAVKTNHGSGACVVIWNGADPAARVPEPTIMNAWRTANVTPAAARPRELAAFLDMNLRLNFYWMYGEWAYRDVGPRVLAEEFLVGEDGSAPLDYRFFVFDGICEAVLVVSGGPTVGSEGCFLLPDWTPLNAVPSHLQLAPNLPEQPPELPEMLRIANRLGRGIDFVRVDFILSQGRILVGELTNYPNAGRVSFRPPGFDRWLGNHWAQPDSFGDQLQAIGRGG